jgi:predicted Zn-dependent protease with MMP-like domain
MIQCTASEFQSLVDQAISELPDDILGHLDNVAISIADWPSRDERARAQVPHGQQLFGLYEGIPLTKRGARYHMVTPDRIILYRGPLLAAHPSLPSLREGIRRTVVHEIAHHLGLDEARVRELGY